MSMSDFLHYLGCSLKKNGLVSTKTELAVLLQGAESWFCDAMTSLVDTQALTNKQWLWK